MADCSNDKCACNGNDLAKVSPPVPGFWDFTAFTPTIPKLYWDVRSQEQRILNLFDLVNRVICYAESIGLAIDGYREELDALKDEFEQFKNGAFLDFYEKQLNAWIDEHMPDLIRRAMRMVFFGLTDDGYFCAYIPDSWSDIEFDTGVVFGRSDYGRLILRYKTQGRGVIDNTYGYSLAQISQGKQIIADVEAATNRGELAYNTLFSNLTDTEVKPFGEVQQEPKSLTPDRGDI